MRFAGIGDNVVDRYVNKRIMFPGGNTVNCAAFASQCGAEAAYVGVLAKDKEGDLIYDSLKDMGVDVTACLRPDGCATEYCDVELRDGDRVFVGSGWQEGKEHRDLTLTDRELAYLKGFDLVHSSCYSHMEDDISKLAELDCVKTFDFSVEEEYRTDEYLKKVCPYINIALFSGDGMKEEDMEGFLEKIHRHGTDYALITMGTKGQLLYDGEQFYRGKVKLITPVDTMGAGDSFFTAFVVSLMESGLAPGERLAADAIERSFEKAAEFSAKTCLVDGAFGYGASY